ncbi:MAG: Rrf2 family transcriptional regulator [Rhodothermales bacterium]
MTSRFTLAVHSLALLTLADEQEAGPVTSEAIAESAATNPVVVKRTLAALGRAGLVGARGGRGGGSWLARPATSISLREVYEALEDDETLIPLHPGGLSSSCQVGQGVASYLDDLYDDLADALKARLGNTTLADVARGVCARVGAQAH